MYDAAQLLRDALQRHRGGRFAEAIALYRQVLVAEPDHPAAGYLLAAAVDASGRADEAIGLLEALLSRRDDHAEAHNHLGAMLAERGNLDIAIDHFRRATQLKPQWPEPADNLQKALADRHNQRGMALAAGKRWDEAATEYRAAIAQRPTCAAHINLGNAIKALGQLPEAAACYGRALALQPGLAEAHHNLGVVAGEQGHWHEAAGHFGRALASRPDYAEAQCELGRSLLQQNRLSEAILAYRRAVDIAPASATAHFHLAFALLLAGELPEGFREFEWRFAWSGMGGTPRPEPRWQGELLAGRTLLVRCEQGYGDARTIHSLCRALGGSRRNGRRRVSSGGGPFAGACAGVSRVVIRGEVNEQFDLQVPLLSVPLVLGTTLATVPARVPYLAADAERIAERRQLLGQQPGLRVGLAWQGDPTHANDRARSIPLREMLALSQVAGVRWYSLQTGPGREQLPGILDRWPIQDLGDALGDFYDTAALVSNLDLVISCDSAPAHLAAALGVPVWLATSFAPDWRWLLNREDSPWYPAMRIFRQQQPGQWAEVFARMLAPLITLEEAGSS